MELGEPAPGAVTFVSQDALNAAWRRMEREHPRDVLISMHLNDVDFQNKENGWSWDEIHPSRLLEWLGIRSNTFWTVVNRMRTAGLMEQNGFGMIRTVKRAASSSETQEPQVTEMDESA